MSCTKVSFRQPVKEMEPFKNQVCVLLTDVSFHPNTSLWIHTPKPWTHPAWGQQGDKGVNFATLYFSLSLTSVWETIVCKCYKTICWCRNKVSCSSLVIYKERWMQECLTWFYSIWFPWSTIKSFGVDLNCIIQLQRRKIMNADVISGIKFIYGFYVWNKMFGSEVWALNIS